MSITSSQVITQALELLTTKEQLFAESAVQCVELREAVTTQAMTFLEKFRRVSDGIVSLSLALGDAVRAGD